MVGACRGRHQRQTSEDIVGKALTSGQELAIGCTKSLKEYPRAMHQKQKGWAEILEYVSKVRKADTIGTSLRSELPNPPPCCASAVI